MDESPVTYKRTVTRRDSFRIDLDENEMRAALSHALGVEIPETAAFRVHDDGGATFCWDVDVEMDPFKSTPATPTDQGLRDVLVDAALGPKPDLPAGVDNRTVIELVPLDESVQNPAEQTLVVGPDLPAGVKVEVDDLPIEERLASIERAERDELSDDSNLPDHDGPVAIEPDAKPGEDRDRERLANIASGQGRRRAMSHFGGTHAPAKPNEDPATGFAVVGDGDEGGIGHFKDERGPEEITDAERPPPIHADAEQCGGTFIEGVTRSFRCHLDRGHDGPCGAAEGCEPEDPPKGRRRSW
jgi:hypothetical protein